MANQAVSRPTTLSGTWGELIGEFIGTMVLVIFGDGCIACFGLFTHYPSPNAPSSSFSNMWLLVTLGWGFAVMLGIYVAGAISGAHLNPAITLGLAVGGRHPWSKVLPYWLAQLLGAFFAAAILYFIYRDALNATLAKAHSTDFVNNVGYVFFTFPNPVVTYFTAFWDEFLGTALFVGLILTIVDARNQPVQANLNPLIIGFLILAIGTSLGLNSGYALNPARDFGPRLWIAIVTSGASLTSYTWIPIVAPLLGGSVGALIFDYTIGKVLEAKSLMRLGPTEFTGEAAREPIVD